MTLPLVLYTDDSLKICGQCKKPLPLSSFHRDSGSKDGRAWRCKECVREYQKEYNKKNSKRNSQASVKWRKDNPVKAKAIDARYRERNRETLRVREKEWGTAHPSRIREIKVRSSVKHREKNKNRAAEQYKENRDTIIAKVSQWQKDNPDKVSARQKRRRARRANAPINDLTLSQWEAILEAFNHCCAYCGKRKKGKLTQEHITPLSRGGSHTLSNVVPACRSCNSKKARGPVLRPVQPLLLVVSG